MPETNNNDTPTTPDISKVELRVPSGTNGVHHAHVGPILAVLIIMLVFIFGGLYLWGGMLGTETPVPVETMPLNDEPETTRANVDQEILEVVSPSDELSAIDADVNSTNFGSLDSDLSTIDIEFDTALSVQ